MKIYTFALMGGRKIIKPDNELWKDFISGKDEAFKAIYEKNFSDLFRYGCYFSNDKDLVKDCIQDLFVNLHKYRMRLTFTDKIKPYLITSFKQIILKKLRSLSEEKKKMVSIDSLSFDYSFGENTTDSDYNDKTALLQDAMNKLTPRQREAVYLKYVTGLSYEELSVAMNLSYQASRNLIYHAVEKLREVISEKALFLLAMICKIPPVSKKNSVFRQQT